ncbi:hypothetical protein VTN00DRAFT_8242 [Thermoascus crustaceus]|uniref:uncharacterized protein n=1 Tax=Thermoascus crustaceus TaxID=5088 RepID=UPI003743A679
MSSPSYLESLPNELLNEVLLNLLAEPPSMSKLHDGRSYTITEFETSALKHLSLTSSRFLDLVRPLLFKHARFDLKDKGEFLSFIKKYELGPHVNSIVVSGREVNADWWNPFWWRPVLRELNPQRLVIVATPFLLGNMLCTRITTDHSWAFDIPLQVLQLEQKNTSVRGRSIIPPELPTGHKSLFSARPWFSLSFNENSSLKAYNHYEYFLMRLPSVFERWGAMTSVRLGRSGDLPEPLLSFSLLTSFHYTAVFPFYNHVKTILNAVEIMTNLRSLSVQLAPGKNDKILEKEQRGSMDPNDPWMELLTGYSLIAHTVVEMGQRWKLERFQSRDYELEALQWDLNTVAADVLTVSGWVHDGRGTWNRVKES